MSRPAPPRIDVLASTSQHAMSPTRSQQRLETQPSFDEASIKYIYNYPKDSPAQTPTAVPRESFHAPAAAWGPPEPSRNPSDPQGSVYDHNPKIESPATTERRRRYGKKFWVLVVVGIAMLAAIGTLAGLYIEISRSYYSLLHSTSSQPYANGSGSSNATSTGASTASSSAALPTATSADSLTSCPGANGQTISVVGTTKLFRRRCDSDFPGGEDGGLGPQGGAFGTILDCVDACAAKVSEMACVGVVYTSAHQCILKSSFGLRRNATGYESAMLVQ